MAGVLLILLLVSLMMTAGSCQTFQYSRGWTNGKRSNDNPIHGQSGFQSGLKIANFPVQGFREYSSEVSTPSLSSSSSSSSTRCSLQMLKMMLQGSGNEELYLLPCEFRGGLQGPYQQQQRRRLHQ